MYLKNTISIFISLWSTLICIRTFWPSIKITQWARKNYLNFEVNLVCTISEIRITYQSSCFYTFLHFLAHCAISEDTEGTVKSRIFFFYQSKFFFTLLYLAVLIHEQSLKIWRIQSGNVWFIMPKKYFPLKLKKAI